MERVIQDHINKTCDLTSVSNRILDAFLSAFTASSAMNCHREVNNIVRKARPLQVPRPDCIRNKIPKNLPTEVLAQLTYINPSSIKRIFSRWLETGHNNLELKTFLRS